LSGDLAFLRLLQISDSQLPTGSFAHSGGLETYAHLGLRPDDLEELLAHQIASGWGRLDLAAAALAWTASEDPAALEDLARDLDAWKVIPSVRQASLGLGQRTLALARRVFPAAAQTLDLSHPHQAVVIGALGHRLGAPKRLVLLAFGQTTVTAALAAATRCMPVAPLRAQEILVALQPALSEAVERIADAPRDALFCCTPALDIRNHQQAALHTRLFQS
jgi:urease accessory protein